MTEPAPQPFAGRRILVVEDEYFLATDVAAALMARGAAVAGPVAEVGEALALVQGPAAIDGAVLDINLRGEMVYRLADELRRRGVPFVFATGYDCESIPAAYRDVPCFEKPVDAAALAGLLPALIAGPGG